MKKISILLFSLLLFACGQLDHQKVRKLFEKKHSKEDFIEIVDKMLEHKKRTKEEKIIVIEGLGAYKQENINEYLLKIYSKYEKDAQIKDAILKSMIAQENPDNIDLFMELISKNEKTPELILQMIGFGTENYEHWRKFLGTKDSDFKQNIISIIYGFSEPPTDKLLADFIDSEEKYLRANLQKFLIHDKERTAQFLNKFILQKKIDDVQNIQPLIHDLDPENLVHFHDLFHRHDNDETIIQIAKYIFIVFGDRSLNVLNESHSKLKDLENRKIIYDICKNINSDKSYDHLVLWRNTTNDNFQKNAIIQIMAQMKKDLPQELIEALDDENTYFNTLNTLPKYIKNSPNSVFRGYQRASDIGKIRLLEYFMKNGVLSILKKVLAISEIKYQISYIRIFTVIHLIKFDLSSSDYEPLLEYMLLQSDDEFEIALEYVKLHPQSFHSFIIKNYSSMIQNSEFREKKLISFFYNTKLSDDHDLLLNKYMDHFNAGNELADFYADCIMNNPNITSELFRSHFDKNADQDKKEAFVNLIKAARSDIKNFALSVVTQDYFFDLNRIGRHTVIKYMKKVEDENILHYLIDNYEKMELIEKKYFNSSLKLFPLEQIKAHAIKIAYLGDDNDVLNLKKMIKFNKFEDPEINFAFAFYYFRCNDFSTAEKYLERSAHDKKKIITNAIDICRDKAKFSQKYVEDFAFLPTDYAQNYKSVVDSILITDFIISHQLAVHPDKEKLQQKKAQYQEQLTFLEQEFKNYFQYISNPQDFTMQKCLQMKLSDVKTKTKLVCGNIVFEAPQDSIYLEIKVQIKNLTENPINVSNENFYLDNNGRKKFTNWQTKYFYKFNGDDDYGYYTIAANRQTFVYLTFMIAASEKKHVLFFEDDELQDITTPLRINRN